MIAKVLKSVFGTRNDRELKRMGKLVKKINTLTEEIGALSDNSARLALAAWAASYPR